MSNLTFTNRPFRLLFCVLLLLLPLATLWNLVTQSLTPRWTLAVGPRLSGVVEEKPLVWTFDAVKSGDLQRAIAERVTAAIPIRPILIRANNEIRMTLFGEVNAPGIVRGRDGQLVETTYIDSWCRTTERTLDERLAKTLPMLRDLQDFYRKRGAVFLYVLTPSKVIDMPEAFADKLNCGGAPALRVNLAANFIARLRQAGIAAVDVATPTHAMKARGVDAFPRGGVHWNDLAVAQAVQAVTEAINTQAGRPLVPSFAYSSTMTTAITGQDRDLADVVNMLFPPLGYAVPKVTYQLPTPCSQSGAQDVEAALVGSSFGHSLASVMIAQSCLRRLNEYFYLVEGRFGGVPYRAFERNIDLSSPGLNALRDVKIMIIEENESFLPVMYRYIEQLHNIVEDRR
jgi:hypothetical protein